jgi:hypothetical protein
MIVIYSDQDVQRLLSINVDSVFLAGPTSRSKDVPLWRPEALDILRAHEYSGQVLVPEYLDKEKPFDFDKQVEWEYYALEHCKKIIFWIPRKMDTMPALTTNVEFGHYAGYCRVFYGRPDDAEKCQYLDWFYRKHEWRPIYNNLKDLLNAI